MREAKGIAGLTALAMALGAGVARAQDLDFPPVSAPPRASSASEPPRVDPAPPPAAGRVQPSTRQPISTVKSTTATRRPVCPDAPADIVKYMADALQVVADESKPEEVRRAFQEAFDDILAAAEKIIANRNARPEEIKEARQYQASALYQGATQHHLPGYRERLERLADDLYQKDGNKSEVAALAAFLNVRASYETEGGLSYTAMDKIKSYYMKRFPRDEAAIDLIADVATAAEQAGDLVRAREAYKLVETDFKRSDMAQRLPKIYERLSLVGQRLDLRGYSLVNNTAVDMNTRARNKVAIVHFWTMWSKPCMPELETLRALYQKRSQEVEIIGVPLDRDLAKLTEFLREYDIDWTQIAPQRASESRDVDGHYWATRYGVTAVPTTFIVARDGTVAATNVRGADIERVVDDVIANRRPSAPASRTATRRPADDLNFGIR